MNGKTAYLLGKCTARLLAGSRYAYHTSLLPNGAKAFINGEWHTALSNSSFPVTNPYSNETLYECTNCDESDAEEAVKAAREAYSTWSEFMTAKERGEILHSWYHIMKKNADQLAELITLEQGKPLEEARSEISYSASFLKWFGEEARRVYGQIVQAPTIHRAHFHTREPIGIVAIITPWNFPSAMITRKAAAALAVGCTVVVKPAEDTPLSALALAQTAKQAGLPDGVFNVVTADLKNTEQIAKYFCTTTDINAISFTGSTEVGKYLLAESAKTVKRVCLELGGNAPLIVFESAHLTSAVEGTMASKFRGSGQTCICANRIYVHSWLFDPFIEELKSQISKLVVGNGMKPGITQGPLINERAVEKVEKLIADAVSKGARVVLGGKRIKGKTCFEPTLLIDVNSDMDIANTEIFGPVLAVQKFETEDEVLELANNTRSGLAAYVFTADCAQMMRVSRRLQVGIIGINEGIISCAEAAFGGVKESGLGREGGSQGIDEFTQWKYICVGF